MTLFQAAIIFAARLMDTTCQINPATNQCMPYDYQVMEDAVTAIVSITDDIQEAETLIRIARWESGGFRKDIATCKVKGDHGQAMGLFQVHPFTSSQVIDCCSSDYKDQARVALERVRDSVAICRMHGYRGSDLLGQYTSGRCSSHNVSAYLRWGSGKELQALVYTEFNVSFPRYPSRDLIEAEK